MSYFAAKLLNYRGSSTAAKSRRSPDTALNCSQLKQRASLLTANFAVKPSDDHAMAAAKQWNAKTYEQGLAFVNSRINRNSMTCPYIDKTCCGFFGRWLAGAMLTNQVRKTMLTMELVGIMGGPANTYELAAPSNLGAPRFTNV